MPPDLVAPLALLFFFLVMLTMAGIYYYGEQWFAEMERRERGEDE